MCISRFHQCTERWSNWLLFKTYEYAYMRVREEEHILTAVWGAGIIMPGELINTVLQKISHFSEINWNSGGPEEERGDGVSKGWQCVNDMHEFPGSLRVLAGIIMAHTQLYITHKKQRHQTIPQGHCLHFTFEGDIGSSYNTSLWATHCGKEMSSKL